MKQDIAYNRIENFYRSSNDKLVAYCNKFFHNTARAEDVVQDAYVNALTYWNTMPEAEEEFAPWFQTVLSNCIRKNWKTELYHGMNTEQEGYEEPSIKASAIPTVIYSQVVDRIGKKSPEHARVLHLFLIDQYKPKEIEEITNIKANNVRQIVHNFRQEIRQEFRWTI